MSKQQHSIWWLSQSEIAGVSQQTRVMIDTGRGARLTCVCVCSGLWALLHTSLAFGARANAIDKELHDRENVCGTALHSANGECADSKLRFTLARRGCVQSGRNPCGPRT